MSSNALMPVPDEEWADIVNKLVIDINEEDVPDDVVRATEMMLVGFPITEVSAELGIETRTIRKWLTTYPIMAATVANGRALLSKWRMSKLEMQFLKAINRSEQVLDLSMAGSYLDSEGVSHFVDPKVLTVIAAQSRYVIGLFAGQKTDVQVTHELGDTVLKAREDALDYIADKLQDQKEGVVIDAVETTYRVLDPKVETGPMLDSDGSPPHGKIGEFDINENGIECHICGSRFKALHNHLYSKHNTSTKDYEMLYMLEQGSVRDAKVEEKDDAVA
ncbi:MerR family transcriptional regulator [Candidatus Pacearchaeota archaeon]|nr:MerR family transcriptional regulator [Candidatus Pacearchaeota archaeon]